MTGLEQLLYMVGGAFILGVVGLIWRIVFDWLKKSDNNKKLTADEKGIHAVLLKELQDAAKNIDWIKEIHDQKDNSGLPLWFVPRDLEKGVRANSELLIENRTHIKDIKEALKEIKYILDNSSRLLDRLEERTKRKGKRPLKENKKKGKKKKSQ